MWRKEAKRVFFCANTLNKPTHSADAVGEWETLRSRVDV